MSKIIVLGGGVVGMATAMMLARQGYGVTVLERDGEPIPESPDAAWHGWERQGVVQFRQAHFMLPAGRQILDAQLPEVKQAMLQAGCVTFNMSTLMPPSIADRTPHEGDDRFVTVTGRRTTIEYAVASCAERSVPVRRGVSVAGLLTGPSAMDGVPHITGVLTTDGQEHVADLVIDAMGRRSKLPDWLEAAGARRPIEEAEESGFMYYTRFFRSGTNGVPTYRAPLLTHFHSFSLLTLPGDADTWSVTVFIFSGDPPLKAIRDKTRWSALVGACPLHAPWLEGEPITDVLAMGGAADRYRRFVVNGRPVATGIVAVGDSWACTNPLGGRGISVGLMQAAGMLEVVQRHLADPLALVLEHDNMSETRLTPWYRYAVAFDRQRIAEINATIHGRSAPANPGPVSELAIAMRHDAELFRAFVEIQSLLALPEKVMARPGIKERVRSVAASHTGEAPPGPSREQLLRMMA